MNRPSNARVLSIPIKQKLQKFSIIILDKIQKIAKPYLVVTLKVVCSQVKYKSTYIDSIPKLIIANIKL